MLETVENVNTATEKSSNAASEKAYKIAQDKFKLLQGALQDAILKYKSSFIYKRHEKKSHLSGVDHPRVIDVRALQSILDNTHYAIPLKDEMLSYIDDPENFHFSKLSPLRRYIRNAIKSYIKQHHINSLEFTDAILAMNLTSACNENKNKASEDEESDTQTSEEQKHAYPLQQELQRTQQLLHNAQQGAQQYENVTQQLRQKLEHVQQDLAKTKSAVVELQHENAEQAQIINRQSATIKTLQAFVSELRVRFENFKNAAYDTIIPLKNMFINLKGYFKRAITNKRPAAAASASNSNAEQPEPLYGEAYRKQVNNELAKGGSGPVRTLYHDHIDSKTGLQYKKGQLDEIDKLYDTIDEKFNEAAQLNEQADQNIVIAKTPIKHVEFVEHQPQVENVSAQASIEKGAIAPPPPPAPPLAVIGAPVNKPAVTPKKKPTAPAELIPDAKKPEGNNSRTVPEQIAERARAREQRLKAESPQIAAPVVKKSFTQSQLFVTDLSKNPAFVKAQEKRRLAMAGADEDASDDWEIEDTSPSPTK